MSLNNYNALQTSIATWLARNDLTASIPDFIRLCESRLNNNADFRVRQQVCKLVATVSGTELALPTDYLGMRELRYSTGKTIAQVSPQALGELKQAICYAPDTTVYCDLGQRLEIYPEVDEVDMEIFYYQEIPALSDTNLSNWLLALAPDIYLYGSLLEATQFMKNDERVGLWSQRYAESVAGLAGADEASRWSGPMTIQVAS